MSVSKKLTAVAQNEQKVYDAGKKSQYDEFWDNYIGGIKASGDYRNCFTGKGWTNTTFSPTQDMTPTGGVGNFFNAVQITDLKGILDKNGVTFDFSKATDFDYFCYNASITHFPVLDISSATRLTHSFDWSKLKSIEKIITKTGLPSLYQVTELESVVIEGEIANSASVSYCTKLTHDSLMSIINALKDYSADTSGTTHKLTMGDINIAKLTADELKIIENKGWTYG